MQTARQHPDQRYIAALVENHPVLIREIYARFSDIALQVVRGNSGADSDAKDLFQEALLAIARQAARPGGVTLTCSFAAFLGMVCKRRWLNELRRRRFFQNVTFDDPEGFAHDTAADSLATDVLARDEKDRIFLTHFQKLAAACRRLLELSWSGLSMEAVGREMGFTYAYVRKRKSECTAQLTEAIQNSPEYRHLNHE